MEVWLIISIIIYIAVIAAMCWSSSKQMRKPSNKKIENFIRKNIKRYK